MFTFLIQFIVYPLSISLSWAHGGLCGLPRANVELPLPLRFHRPSYYAPVVFPQELQQKVGRLLLLEQDGGPSAKASKLKRTTESLAHLITVMRSHPFTRGQPRTPYDELGADQLGINRPLWEHFVLRPPAHRELLYFRR